MDLNSTVSTSRKKFQKSQEEIKRQSPYDRWWQNHKETKSYYDKGHFLPEEEFFGGRTSSVKTRPWKHQRGCFLILKSLNSDNLQRRLQESIKGLGSFKELWKFFRMQAQRRRQSKNTKIFSEHMPVKKNSQDEWLLRGSWPIYRLANGY